MTDQTERSGNRQHPDGGQQGSSQRGKSDSEETKAGNAMETSKPGGGAEKRHGEDFEETDEQKQGGDPDNASETTGGSESGGEDKGARM